MKRHVDRPNLNIHVNAPSVRFDTWAKLRRSAGYLMQNLDSTHELTHTKRGIQSLLDILAPMEAYWGYPGSEEFQRLVHLYRSEDHAGFYQAIIETSDLLDSGEYRRVAVESALGHAASTVHYFDLLLVSKLTPAEEKHVREDLESWRCESDGFVYNTVVVNSFDDALMAILLNFNIQAVIIHDDFKTASTHELKALPGLKESLYRGNATANSANLPVQLGNFIHELRPEINLFLSTRISPEKLAGEVSSYFDRIFHRYESSSELHLSVIKSVANRYRTPFFDALKKYSREPVGTFHALPISRGNSVFKSPWLQDFYTFYGRDIFLAESSATTGGLDSILQPTGTLKAAQESARRCYGSQQTFFATNGTSTSNKIVVQALTRPGDIVLVDRSCHESHHFAFVLTGCLPLYLSNYSLDTYSIAGAVRLVTIKRQLVELAGKGLLDKVRMVDLTNCTFDGLTYNVQHYMEQILAIKPDMVFLWDEAWFAFARFVPHYRQRTAMYSAEKLADKYRSSEYRDQYDEYKKSFLAANPDIDENWIEHKLMPDPDKVRIRVYATQSTHKTLSCFRQGSMIHIWDEDFNERVREQFTKAYFTHTTTSPNYQILASLDVSRRQVHLEGYELVQRSIEMSLVIRRAINNHPLLSRYFKALGPTELIPEQYRRSGVKSGFRGEKDWETVARAWDMDDFVLDPCRITVCTAKTGIDGFTFRTKYLAERSNIQVNKTGLNSICIMTNVGTTRSAVAYLIESLIQIAEEFEQRDRGFSAAQREKFRAEYNRVTQLPPLPDYSGFHPVFRLYEDCAAGDVRRAFFESYEHANVEYYRISELQEELNAGRLLVAATFIVPVPPGFPMLCPGQVLDQETLTFLSALSPSEILGLDPDLGIRFFNERYMTALDRGQLVGSASDCDPASVRASTSASALSASVSSASDATGGVARDAPR